MLDLTLCSTTQSIHIPVSITNITYLFCFSMSATCNTVTLLNCFVVALFVAMAGYYRW